LFLGEWPGYPLYLSRRTPPQKDAIPIPIAVQGFLAVPQKKIKTLNTS
jgi:hypothetical protein